MIEKIKFTRSSLLNTVSELSVEELNEVPPGFNNNIIWNLAHLTASQQGMCYVRAGVPARIDEQYLIPFKSGTKPERFIGEDEIKILKELLLSSLEQFEADLQNNVFENYGSWTTRSGIPINNIDDALQFILFHEGVHSGCIMAMKRVVKNRHS